MSVEVVDGLPVAGGKPAIKIMASFSEKIGLPNYSNVEVGPISVTRYVEDGDDDHVAEEIRKTARIVENFLAEEREFVLKTLQAP